MEPCFLLIEEVPLPNQTDFLDNGINKEKVQKDCLNHPENLIGICWRVILLSLACFCLFVLGGLFCFMVVLEGAGWWFSKSCFLFHGGGREYQKSLVG